MTSVFYPHFISINDSIIGSFMKISNLKTEDSNTLLDLENVEFYHDPVSKIFKTKNSELDAIDKPFLITKFRYSLNSTRFTYFKNCTIKSFKDDIDTGIARIVRSMTFSVGEVCIEVKNEELL